MSHSLVIMGVAGCGKSSLGAELARATGLRLVEGDDYHSSESRTKMSQGKALLDADREGWLTILSEQLRANPQGLVLTCSALKQANDWLHRNAASADAMQAGARGLAITLARSMAAALLCRQAAYSIRETGDIRPSLALARFVSRGLAELEHYRLSSLIKALMHNNEYRAQIVQRAARFNAAYPRLIQIEM